jgi:replicative DNA helicase
LGGILLDPEAIGRVMEVLTPDAFYIGAHRDIYRAALDLHAKGQPADLMTVTMWLKDHNRLEDMWGGRPGLPNWSTAPSAPPTSTSTRPW